MVVQSISIGEINSEWITPAFAEVNRAVSYLPIGGYTMGSCNTQRSLAARVVHKNGASRALCGISPRGEF